MKYILPKIACQLFLLSILIACTDEKKKDDNQINEVLGEELNIGHEEFNRTKQIEWCNGNIYSYDYTETITNVDSLGNEYYITVYKNNPPSENEIVCEPLNCKWCNDIIYSTNYSIEEYPDINWIRGHNNIESFFGMLAYGMMGVIRDRTYYDIENKRIRTEWRTECNYPGPNGFCSLKCKNEYKLFNTE
jgi:hypothetical protein